MKTLRYVTATMLVATLGNHQAAAAPQTNPLSAHIGQCVSILPNNDIYVAPGVLRTANDTHIELDVDPYGDGRRLPILYFMTHVEAAIPDPDNLLGMCGAAQSTEVAKKLRAMVSTGRE